MTAPTRTLPAPPGDAPAWSICSIAGWLGVFLTGQAVAHLQQVFTAGRQP